MFRKAQITDHGLFAEIAVNASHFILVHLVELGMNLQTGNSFVADSGGRRVKVEESQVHTLSLA